MGILQAKSKPASSRGRNSPSKNLGGFKDYGELQLKWAEEDLRRYITPEEDRLVLRIGKERRDVFEQASALRLYGVVLSAKRRIGYRELLLLAETIQREEVRLQAPLEEAFSILLVKDVGSAVAYSRVLSRLFRKVAEAWDESSTREPPFSHIHKILRRAPTEFIPKVATVAFESYSDLLTVLKTWENMPLDGGGDVLPFEGPVDATDVALWSAKREALKRRKNPEEAEPVFEAAIRHKNKEERIQRLRKALFMVRIVEKNWSEETASPYSFLEEGVKNLELTDVDNMLADLKQVKGEDVYTRARYWAELGKILPAKRA